MIARNKPSDISSFRIYQNDIMRQWNNTPSANQNMWSACPAPKQRQNNSPTQFSTTRTKYTFRIAEKGMGHRWKGNRLYCMSKSFYICKNK